MTRIFSILRSVAEWSFVLLFFATVVLWIRSFSVADTWEWTLPDGQGRTVYSSRGQFGMIRRRDVYSPAQLHAMNIIAAYSPAGIQRKSQAPDAFEAPWQWLRVKTEQNRLAIRNRAGRLGLWNVERWSAPYWLPAAVFAVPLPFLVIRISSRVRTRRRMRRLKGRQCLICGYDLRATPARCPECGAPSDPSGDALA